MFLESPEQNMPVQILLASCSHVKRTKLAGLRLSRLGTSKKQPGL